MKARIVGTITPAQPWGESCDRTQQDLLIINRALSRLAKASASMSTRKTMRLFVSLVAAQDRLAKVIDHCVDVLEKGA